MNALRQAWKYRKMRFRCINCGQVGRYRWHLKHRKECTPKDRAGRRREQRYCPVCRTKHAKGRHG